MLRYVDDILNEITMYRLLTYGLGLLAVVSLVFSAAGIIGMPFGGLLLSFAVLMAAGYGTNTLFSYLWKIPTNNESGLITSFILFFVLPPATTASQALYVALAGMLAMASKYLIVRQGAHIFNPAAFGAAAVSLTTLLPSAWWIGSSALWPFTLGLGLLVVRKIRRGYMFGLFAVVAAIIGMTTGLSHGVPLGQEITFVLLQTPLIFLGSIMLTEPSTMPSSRRYQLVFAGLVAALYAFHWSAGPLRVNPEAALLLGNIFAAVVSLRARSRLRLLRIEPVGAALATYVFQPERTLTYQPGQYLEWTLPIPMQRADGRGNRRTFTVASSPTEPEIMLGVKFYDKPSRFKQMLRSMQAGESIYAGQVAGNFTLPDDPQTKLLFIAGGVGITPFRSMIRFITDSGQQRDIVLLYLVSKADEVMYEDVFNAARNRGVKTVKILSDTDGTPADWDGLTGRFSRDLLVSSVPDYAERTYYVSGPDRMVRAAKDQLHLAGISRRHIKSDYFSGY